MQRDFMVFSAGSGLGSFMHRGKEAPDLVLQQADELRLHVLVLIRYVQADNACVCEMRLESLLKLASVSLLHHEDDLGPLDELRRDRILSVVVEAC